MDTLQKKEVKIIRILNAPRELVFDAWTDVKHLAEWWGPAGFTNPVCKVDAKAGGKIYIEMRSSNGTIYPMNGMFKEIIRPEKIVFISGALDKNGNQIFEVLNTVTFADENGKTKLTLHAVVDDI
ncbi:MAG TPA: SRPBCC domain-containing protein, partial [Puia sp.]|nr:SRPBCC domain-containing protein [Puia sp.]